VFTMAMGAGAGAGPPTAERMVLTRAASICEAAQGRKQAAEPK
jgi:hypothetical protein